MGPSWGSILVGLLFLVVAVVKRFSRVVCGFLADLAGVFAMVFEGFACVVGAFLAYFVVHVVFPLLVRCHPRQWGHG